jgi:uncharacterized protein (DUF1778 family)
MSRDEAQLNFRIKLDDKLMLKHAAKADGKSLSEFIREAAVEKAEQRRDERISTYEGR